MTEYFTVPEGKEPTEEQARSRASAVWSKWMRNSPNTFKEEGRAEYVEERWAYHLEVLRAEVGEPLSTADYSEDVPKYGDLMTVEEFRGSVECGGFIDYDGHGCPAKDGKMARINICPSNEHLIPLDATHFVWFNR